MLQVVVARQTCTIVPVMGGGVKASGKVSFQERNLEWLRDELVLLFEDAIRGTGAEGRIDHSVCVQYAGLLRHLLPGKVEKDSTTITDEQLAKIREALAREQAGKA